LLHDSIGGENVMSFARRLTAKLIAKRMSGEMNTSLGNGFSNYMMLKWLTFRKDPTASVRAAVEGDDGLFKVTPKESSPTTEDFTNVGAIIKLEKKKNLSEASFCGLIFDLDDQVVIADPLKHLAKVGWYPKRHCNCTQKDGRALLRARGYSFVYQYPGCPILSSLGYWILRNTDDITEKNVRKVIDREASYDRERLLTALEKYNDMPSKPITDNTRDLMFRYFGVSSRQQILIEKWFMENELGPINIAAPDGPLDLPWEKCWRQNWDVYTTDVYDPGAMWGSGDIHAQVDAEVSHYCEKLLQSGHSRRKVDKIRVKLLSSLEV
jgi:hypothetical protein